MKIVQLTSVHPRYDSRIFEKECVFLGKNDLDISLIVADGKGNEIKNGVQIYDIGNRFKKNRFLRIIFCPFLVMFKGLKIKGDIFHFHDPELLIAGVILKIFFRKKVIYDVHEDVPLDILSKFYLQKSIRKFLSIAIEVLEKICSKKFDGIILAVPYFQERFIRYNSKCIVINNYPVIYTNEPLKLNFHQRDAICYVGAITRIRGLKEVIIACNLANVKLILAGNFEDQLFEKELIAMQEWAQVEYHSFIPRKKIQNVYEKSFAGIINFLPEPNHINSSPNKFYEYMMAGLPIICSNFPSFNEIINLSHCGITVDPTDPKSIANGIIKLKKNPNLEQLGMNGKSAVLNSYNWEIEEKKLINFYKNL